MPFFDLKTQQKKIFKDISRNINNVLSECNFILGPEVKKMEKALSNITKSKYCISVSSGTEALLISLMSLNIKPGDEIITTPFSYISTAEVIVLLQAKPVFVDVRYETCNINPELIEEKISKKTKGIIAVNIFGNTADYSAINKIAKKNKLFVIEDAAQSFGAQYKNKFSCNLTDIGCTSFFPTKPLGCYGDGGAIFTNKKLLADKCRALRVHGQVKKWKFDYIGVGGRMDTLQCAIILSKLKLFHQELNKKRRIAKLYDNFFKSKKIKYIRPLNNSLGAYALYTILIKNRDEIIKKAKKYGLLTSIYYKSPINAQSPYKKFFGKTKIAKKVSSEVLSIEINPYQNNNKIFSALEKVFK